MNDNTTPEFQLTGTISYFYNLLFFFIHTYIHTYGHTYEISQITYG